MKSASCFILLGLISACVALPSTPDSMIWEDDTTPDSILVQLQDRTNTLHDDAASQITEMIQSGKSETECRSIARSMAQVVTDDVGTNQKLVDGMDDGIDSCKDEEKSQLDQAKNSLNQADIAKKAADGASETAAKATFKLAPVKFNPDTSKICDSIFNDPANKQAAKEAKAKAKNLNSEALKAAGAFLQATKDNDAAIASAKKAVTACYCKAKEAVTNFMSKIKDHKAAWEKSQRLNCALDGKSAQDCNIAAVPVVKPPTMNAHECNPTTNAQTTITSNNNNAPTMTASEKAWADFLPPDTQTCNKMWQLNTLTKLGGKDGKFGYGPGNGGKQCKVGGPCNYWMYLGDNNPCYTGKGPGGSYPGSKQMCCELGKIKVGKPVGGYYCCEGTQPHPEKKGNCCMPSKP